MISAFNIQSLITYHTLVAGTAAIAALARSGIIVLIT